MLSTEGREARILASHAEAIRAYEHDPAIVRAHRALAVLECEETDIRSARWESNTQHIGRIIRNLGHFDNGRCYRTAGQSRQLAKACAKALDTTPRGLGLCDADRQGILARLDALAGVGTPVSRAGENVRSVRLRPDLAQGEASP